MLFFREKIKQANGLKKYLGYVITPAIAVIALGAIAFYAMVPKLNDSEVLTGRHSPYGVNILQSEVRSFLEGEPALLEKSNEEITDAILKYLRLQSYMAGPKKNTITGQDLKSEDSPGNFTVDREEGKVVIRFYREDGSVIAIRPKRE
jgi:hypothetical protein